MRRLIEEAFPLKKVSEDSKHEKSAGRKGHISTLHIWPARRPLAACRAAVIGALLPDPADAPPEVRREYERLAGSPDPVKQREELCKRIEKVTRWGTNGKLDEPELDVLRDLIRKTYGGRVPTVLDIFAGGGAIPLETMRLGAHAVAVEYNPVAWFILKCTLEFPSKLAGKTWPLPPRGADAQGPQLFAAADRSGDLAAHVRYWGNWVRERVERDLAPYFPKVNGQNPVAYFWARTVPCPDPQCCATIPLVKTLWLCTKEGKERALRLVPDPSTRQVSFEVFTPRDKRELGRGTVEGRSALCPFHEPALPIPLSYVKECGKTDRLGVQLTAVCVEGPGGKEYRAPTPEEVAAADRAVAAMPEAMSRLPFGKLSEPVCDQSPSGGPGVARLPKFGLLHWGQVFAPRQQLALGVIAKWTRAAHDEVLRVTGDAQLAEAVLGYLYCAFAKVADYNSSIATWHITRQIVRNSFAKFALPMTWDFSEVPPASSSTGGYSGAVRWITDNIDALCGAAKAMATLHWQSATDAIRESAIDALITDPPYYGAIPYADLSDFFYVWLRRIAGDLYPEVFVGHEVVPRSSELVQHAAYGGGNHESAKRHYEAGMAQAFRSGVQALSSDGTMVVVFANKEPAAWDALVTSLIDAGCTVTGSWPIDTELTNKIGAGKAAYLATSIWLVCRRRPENAGIGRYKEVRREMEARIGERLRYFWDLGISGPDFVWAAVGPALEAYSRYKEVRRLDGKPFTVPEFLREVRRLVTDFALGQILHGASTEGLDDWTRYYLMHRASFALDSAPAGECILLAQGYNLDLDELRGPRAILAKGKRAPSDEDEDESEGGGSGSALRLLAWDERKRDDLGIPHPTGGLPFIDALHRAMRLWTAGDATKVRDYLDEHGLKQSDLFWTVAQAVLEMSDPKSRERTLLEAIVAWGRGKDARTVAAPVQGSLFPGGSTT